MTAEVLVMNKHGVAIAADSAVTIEVPGAGPKIYNTVNKLFELGVGAPVAIMIHGTVEFAGLPWETLINDYRGKIGKKPFDTIDEWAEDFLKYLQFVDIDANDRSDMFFSMIFGHFTNLTRELRDGSKVEWTSRNSTTEVVQDKLFDLLIEKEKSLLSLANIPSLNIDRSAFIREYRREIFHARAETIIDSFTSAIFDKNSLKKIWDLAYLYTVKDVFSQWSSGIIIAGFGDKQLLPGVRGYTIDGMVFDRMKYKLTTERDVTKRNQGMVIPFAQTEMVDRFMGGVDKDYQKFVSKLFETLVRDLPRYMVNEFLDGQEGVLETVNNIVAEKLGNINRAMSEYRRKMFTGPIIDAVKSLPKHEMATLAEALVQITSLRRKMSTDMETVGGPIDTVVISKGDGLVWIKRKNYYDPNEQP